jgi:ribosomal protein S18 acetylase RimI-like enzyme
MANLNRFACHETETLASDLARLLQPASPGTLVAGSAASCAARAAVGFPGIILLYEGRPCAAVGYHRESEGTVVISEPVVLMDAVDNVRHALCDRLLKQIKHRTAADGAQRLHFLQQKSSGDPKFEELLKAQRFLHATDILQWELSVAAGYQCSSQDRYEFQRCDVPVTDAVSAGELQSALGAILKCSEDLSSQPQPTASDLLTRWQHNSATVFLCRIESRIACVISLGSRTMTSAAIAADTLPADASFCIEYIGVLPEYRRRGIARLMIGQIPVLTGLCGDGPTRRRSAETFKVTAYSDATNGPAISLYERAGFVRTARMQLWCCDLHLEVNR